MSACVHIVKDKETNKYYLMSGNLPGQMNCKITEDYDTYEEAYQDAKYNYIDTSAWVYDATYDSTGKLLRRIG